MASSEQFPSGLNKWAGTDIPTRLDFLQDNQIIDQSAMWKSVYDSQDDVALQGGIPSYVGQQTQLSLEEAQGYAQQYTDAYNRASATFSADALEISSNVPRTNNWYEVQFVAPENYDPNKQTVIDGDIVNVIGTDGTALWAGAWQAGAVVTLNKNEDNAFFSTSNASMTTLQAEISALKNQVAGIKTIPSREPLFSGTWNHGTSKTIDMKGYSVIAANTYIGPMVLMIYGNGYSGIGGMRYSNANFGVYATLSFTATSGTTRTMSLDIRNSSSGAEIITTIYGLFK